MHIRLVNGFESKANFAYLYIFRVLKLVLWVDVTKGPSGRKNTGQPNQYVFWTMVAQEWPVCSNSLAQFGVQFRETFWFNATGSLTAYTLDFDIKTLPQAILPTPSLFWSQGQIKFKRETCPFGTPVFTSYIIVGSPSQLPPILFHGCFNSRWCRR